MYENSPGTPMMFWSAILHHNQTTFPGEVYQTLKNQQRMHRKRPVHVNFRVHTHQSPRVPSTHPIFNTLPTTVNWNDEGKIAYCVEHKSLCYCDGTEWKVLGHKPLEEVASNDKLKLARDEFDASNLENHQAEEKLKDNQESTSNTTDLKPGIIFNGAEELTHLESNPAGQYTYPSNIQIDEKGRVVHTESGDVTSSIDRGVVVVGPDNTSGEGRYNTIVGAMNSSPGFNFNSLFGHENVARDSLNLMLGTNNTSNSRLGVLLGDANANHSPGEVLTESCVLIGSDNTIDENNRSGNHVVIGSGCQVSTHELAAPCIVVGHLNTAKGGNNIVLSPAASTCNGNNSIGIGTGCNDNGHTNTLMVGHGVSATSDDQIAIGSKEHPYSTKDTLGAKPKKIAYISILLNGSMVSVPYYP
jgi:hypothetical protein